MAKLQALQGVEAEHHKTKGVAAQARTENETSRPSSSPCEPRRQDLAAKLQTLQGVEAEHHKTKGDAAQARTENENSPD